MNRFLKETLVFATVLLGACSFWKSAQHTQPVVTPDTTAQSFTDQELKSLFYADLGPDKIDVSSYPATQQAQYQLFAKVCSQCHGLARAINSPTVSHTAWNYYVLNMRLRSHFKPGAAYTKNEARAIVDFLSYDSQVRKVQQRENFDALSSKLQKRFNETISERMRRLTESLKPIHSQLTSPQ